MLMDIRFSPHNTHLESPDAFSSRDPHLARLSKLPMAHASSLLDDLPFGTPGIYTLGGGRQVGKTTLTKQWISHLLKKKVPPEAIRYLSGELIDDHHSLVRHLTDIFDDAPLDNVLHYLILDEVTYIKDWDKGIKYVADAGLFEQTAILLTGSDIAFISDARMRFPGRRGPADQVDFHLYPLSFRETVLLKGLLPPEALSELNQPNCQPPGPVITTLFKAFQSYLIHGGFLTAINDMAAHNRILPSTFAIYSDWIRGDMIKKGKKEHYLRELLDAVIRHTGSQISWNALAQSLSIDHPQTVSDYAALLVSMDALFIQQALVEDKLAGAPKKARKLMFTDPFIHHAIYNWLNPTSDPYRRTTDALSASAPLASAIAEAVSVSHYRRRFPTYYIKAKGEVDIAYIHRNRFWPIEVKWTNQLRPGDLKQIVKYPNARILTRNKLPGAIQGIPTAPLPLALFQLT